MDKSAVNRWDGKSAEDVLAEAFQEIRGPINLVTGYLDFLKTADLPKEQAKQFIELALNYALSVKGIVDSVLSDYLKIQREDR